MFTMLSTFHNDDWMHHTDPFSHFREMEAEMAELRTMTKVTKLRQQIECRQEGAWMVVQDVPDERSKSGTRKITSFGHASRSVTRSVSHNIHFNGDIHGFEEKPHNGIIVEFPEDSPEPQNKSEVEIVEVEDDPPPPAKPLFDPPPPAKPLFDPPSPAKPLFDPSPPAKPLFDPPPPAKPLYDPPTNNVPIDNPSLSKNTSVITLGKGNIVFMNPDSDSNINVTAISKGKVADAVKSLEKAAESDKTDKKTKKVGFCKTEVHFTPDTGKFNIVETDEKPPPTQDFRKKKRIKSKSNPTKSTLPKLYFGDQIEPFSSTSNTNEGEQNPLMLNKDYNPADTNYKNDLFTNNIRSPLKSVRKDSPMPLRKNDPTTISWASKLENNRLVDTSLKSSKLIHDAEYGCINRNASPAVPLEKETRDVNLLSKKMPDRLNFVSLASPRKSTSESSKPFLSPKNSCHNTPHFLGNVSPKLRSLIQNNAKHEEEFRQKNLLGMSSPTIPDNGSDLLHSKQKSPLTVSSTIDIKISDDNEKITPVPRKEVLHQPIKVASVTQVHVNPEVKHEFQIKQKEIMRNHSDSERDLKLVAKVQSPPLVQEAINVKVNTSLNRSRDVFENHDKDKVIDINAGPAIGVSSVNKKEKSPPRISATCIVKPHTVKISQRQEQRKSEESKRSDAQFSVNLSATKSVRETNKREIKIGTPSEASEKVVYRNVRASCTKSKTPVVAPVPKPRKSVQDKVKTEIAQQGSKLQKLIKNTTKEEESVRLRKPKEPLRSFEKVSNGWVGHCIVPIKNENSTTREITVVRTNEILKTGATSTGTKKKVSTVNVSDTTTKQVVRNRSDLKLNKPSLVEKKQFSLSKEHLRSAKLVKETIYSPPSNVSKRLAMKNTSASRVKDESGSSSLGIPPKVRPRVNVVKPMVETARVTHLPRQQNKTDRLRGRRKSNDDPYGRIRRDSEQSDDSVTRADEEVRALMCSKHLKNMKACFLSCLLSAFKREMSLVDESGDLESHLEETPDTENLATPQEPTDDERTTKAPERPGVLDLPEETPKALEYLNQLGGTVTQRGELVSFIAEDLETKIKLSSPGPKEDYIWRPPSFDVNILNDLEIQASQVAASVDSLTENLAEVLHGMSALTVDCLETYRDVVCKACDSVDMNIKSMYQLMAKCEELSIAMAPIYKLSAQIKNIKHLLDVLESITG